MKFRKCTTWLLCMILMLNLVLPAVYASDVDNNDSGNIIIGEACSAYYFENSEYRYCVYLNTTTGNGCFSILFISDPDYLYEYYFTVDCASINVNSIEYWTGVTSDIFANSQLWTQVYLPSVAIEVPDVIYGKQMTRSTNHAKAGFAPLLAEHLGTDEYTGRILATSYPNGMIFHVYEDLEFLVTESHSITLSQALSVAGIVVGFFNVWAGVAISVFATYQSVIVESGSTVANYYVAAFYDRTVRRRDSDVWLNNTHWNIGFDGYYISSLDEPYAIDFNSREDIYNAGKEYFEDLYQQLDDGYMNYIT